MSNLQSDEYRPPDEVIVATPGDAAPRREAEVLHSVPGGLVDDAGQDMRFNMEESGTQDVCQDGALGEISHATCECNSLCAATTASPTTHPGQIDGQSGDQVVLLEKPVQCDVLICNLKTLHIGLVPASAINRPLHYPDGKDSTAWLAEDSTAQLAEDSTAQLAEDSTARRGEVGNGNDASVRTARRKAVSLMSSLVSTGKAWKSLVVCVKPVSFDKLDLYLAAIMEKTKKTFNLQDLRELCSEASKFVSFCSDMVAVTAEETSSFSEECQQAKVRVFLVGVRVLLHLPCQSSYSDLEDTSEFKSFVKCMNRQALCTARPDFAATLLGNSTLLEALRSSLPVDHTYYATRKPLTHHLATNCSRDSVFLLFVIMIVEGCIQSIGKHPDLVDLGWNEMSPRIKWTDPLLPATSFLHALCNVFKNGFFDCFNCRLPVDVIIGRMFQLDDPQDTERDLSFVEGVWPMIYYSKAPQDVTLQLIRSIASLFDNASAEFKMKSEHCAALYLEPSALGFLLKQHQRNVTDLRDTYNSIEFGTHCRKDEALRTIQQLVFDTYYEQPNGNVDPLVDIASGIASDNDAISWKCTCMSLAIVSGQEIGKFQCPWTSTAEMFDQLGRTKHANRIEQALGKVITSLHYTLGCDPLHTANTIMESSFLRTCRQESPFESQVLNLQTTSTVKLHVERALSTLHSIQIADDTRAIQGDVAEDNCMMLFWASYCAGLVECCNDLPEANLPGIFTIIQGHLQCIRKQMDEVPCTIGLAGSLASALMEIFHIHKPLPEQAPSTTVICILEIGSKSEQHFASLGRKSPFQLSAYKAYSMELNSLINRLEERRYSHAEYTHYALHAHNLNSLCQAVQLATVDQLKSFEDIDLLFAQRMVLLEWLASKGVDDTQMFHRKLETAARKPSYHLCSMEELLEIVDEKFTAKLSFLVGSAAQDCTGYEYIVETVEKSKICFCLSASARTAYCAGLSTDWSYGIQDILTQIFEGVERLLSLKAQYSELSILDVVGCVDRQDGKISLSESSIFSCSKAHQANVSGIHRLERLLWSIAWRMRAVKGVVRALRLSNSPDDHVLQAWVDEVEKMNPAADASLLEVDEDMRSLHLLTEGYQLRHFQFFDLVQQGHCDSLFRFVEELHEVNSPIRNRFGVLNTRLESDPHGSALIQSLVSAERVIEPLFHKLPPADKLENFRLSTFTYANVYDAVLNLGTVWGLLDSTVINSFDDAMTILQCLGDQTTAKADITRDDSSRYCYKCRFLTAGAKDHLTMAETRQFYLFLPYFNNSNSMHLASQLTKSLVLLEKVLNKVLELEANGHFAYLEQIEKEAIPISQDYLRRKLDDFTQELQDWQSKLPEAKAKCPVLSLFSNYDIGSMVRYVSPCRSSSSSAETTSTTEQAKWCVSRLLWHLLSAAPLAKHKPGMMQKSSITNLFKSGKITGCDSLESLVSLLLQLFEPNYSPLTQVRKIKAVRQLLCTVNGCNSSRDFTQALASLLCHHFRGNPLGRVQFLFCSPSTSEDDLKSFCKAAAETASQFAMCGIDMLSGKCRSMLLKIQHDLRSTPGRAVLIYLCYSKVFAESWPELSGVHRDPLLAVSYTDIQECYKLHGMPARRKLNLNLIMVSGAAGVGKSLWISEKCEREDGTKPIVIDLDRLNGSDDTCLLLANASQKGLSERSRSIHFRVPADADLVEINQVFFELVWCGAIRASDKKTVFAIEPSSAQRQKWFVEVQDDMNLGGAGDASLTDAVSMEIPFLSVAATNQCINNRDNKMILNEQQRELAKVLNWFLHPDDHHPALAQPGSAPLSDETCLSLFDQLMRKVGDGTQNRMQERLLLQYIYIKWQFILKNTELRALSASYRYLCWEVINQLIREAKFLSKPDLRCVFEECPQGFLVYDPFSLMISSKALESIPVLSMPTMTSHLPGKAVRKWRSYPITQGKIMLLSWTFGISGRDVDMLIRRKKFVLTADFAFKLFLIHERQRLGRPLVLESETGTGKTYLLQMYSILSAFALEKRWKGHNGRLLGKLLKSIIFDRFWGKLEEASRLQFPKTVHVSAGDSLTPTDSTHGFSEDVEHLMSGWVYFLEHLRPESRFAAKRALRDGVKSWLEEFTILKPTSNFEELVNTPNLTDAESQQLLTSWLDTKPKNLFLKMLVHPGLLKSEIRMFLFNEVLELARSTPGHVVVVFFDEFNTSKYINTFKEVMFDGTFDGHPFPHRQQLFFVAAVNPAQKPEKQRNSTIDPQNSPDTMARWDNELGQVYHVYYQLPKIASFHRWTYKSLTSHQELEDYTASKIEFLKDSSDLLMVNARTEFSDDVLLILSKYLFHSYRYCQEEVTDSFVSQRDVQRVFKLIPHLWNMEVNRRKAANQSFVGFEVNVLLVSCILISIAMVFYVRLPVTPTRKYPKATRSLLDQYVTSKVQGEFPSAVFHEESLKNALEAEIRKVVTHDNFDIPDGVALTPALQENIFCMIACIQLRIPLAVIGEPGSSKTLAYHIVRQNLCGERGSVKEYCRQFGGIDPFFCQCSPESSTDQIQRLFKVAINRQKTSDHRKVTVFLDEAELLNVKQNRMVMKVLHPYLDEPEVSFVAMSNHWFDAANTNRMLTVCRSRASNDDLISLAYGCIGASQESEDVSKFLKGVCAGYRTIVEKHPKWFHQRDIIALFRFFRRHRLVNGASEICIREEEFLQGIEENFGGLDEEQFKWVANTFFEKVHDSLQSFAPSTDHQQLQNSVEVLLRIGNQLQCSKGKEHFANTSSLAPRFQLLIDDYGCDFNTIDMLYLLGVLSKQPEDTQVLQISSQTQKGQEEQCATLLAQLRDLLHLPCTVVIVNSPALNIYLHELLNQSYQTIMVEGKQRAFSNIAMRDSTFPCQVHAEFRCVVVMSRSLVDRERTPFLSRFSKFSIHPRDGWAHVIKNAKSPDLLRAVESQCELFTKHVSERYFVGCGREAGFSGTMYLTMMSFLSVTPGQSFVLDRSSCASSSVTPTTVTREIVARYFQMMPLEWYVKINRLFTPQRDYHKFYFDSRRQSFTLRHSLECALKAASAAPDNSSKLLLLTKSLSSDVHTLSATHSTHSMADMEKCLGRELARQTTVKACDNLHRFFEAHQAVEDFCLGSNSCVIFSFDVSQPLQKAAIGPMKRLIEKFIQLANFVKPKVFVILLHSLLQSPAYKAVHGAVLNGWRSFFVSVDSMSHLCPVTVHQFVSFARWSYMDNPYNRDTLLQTLKVVLLARSNLFSEEFCRRLTYISESADVSEFVPKEFLPLLRPLSKERPSSCPKRLSAIQLILKRMPMLFDWLADALLTWIMKEGTEWIENTSMKIIREGLNCSLVDRMFNEVDAVLKELMQTVLLATLNRFNLQNILPLLNSHSGLAAKLLMLVESSRIAPSADGHITHLDAQSYSTPYFEKFIKRFNAVDLDVQEFNPYLVNIILKKDVILRELLSERNYLESCLPDYIQHVFSWRRSPSLTIQIASHFVNLNFHECTGCGSSVDLLSFSQVLLRKERSVLLCLLHGSAALHQLNPGQFQSCLDELLGSTNSRNLVFELCCVLAERLWEALVQIISVRDAPGKDAFSEEDADQFLGDLLKWQNSVSYVMQYWPFRNTQENMPMASSVVHQSVMEVVRSHPGEMKLMTAAGLVLSCLTRTTSAGLFVILRALIPNDKPPNTPLEVIFEQLLKVANNVRRHSSEAIQLKHGCAQWALLRLEALTFTHAEVLCKEKDFVLLLKCIHGSWNNLEFPQGCIPASLSAMCLRRLEQKVVNDLTSKGSAQQCTGRLNNNNQVQNVMESLINKILVTQSNSVEPIPLDLAYYALVRQWKEAFKPLNIDLFQYYVNLVCENTMSARSPHANAEQQLCTLPIQRKAVMHIAVQLAGEKIRTFTRSQQISADSMKNIAKLFAKLTDKLFEYKPMFIWNIVMECDWKHLQICLAGMADTWAKEVIQCANSLALLQQSTIYLSECDVDILPIIVDQPAVKPTFDLLQDTLLRPKRSKPEKLLTEWFNSQPNVTGVMEACVVWTALKEYTVKPASPGFRGLANRTLPKASYMLRRTAFLLFNHPELLPPSFISVLRNGDRILRDVFVSTLATVFALGRDHHLYTFLSEPASLASTFIIGATSGRGKTLGEDLNHQTIIDGFFRLCAPCRGGKAMWPMIAFEADLSAPHLTYVANILCAIQVCVVLTWNVVLFPPAMSGCSVLTAAETPRSQTGQRQHLHLVERHIDLVELLVEMLTESDVNMSRFSTKGMILASLERMLATHSNKASSFRSRYATREELYKAEAQFLHCVAEPALDAHCKQLNDYLGSVGLGPKFADLHWQQLLTRFDPLTGLRALWYESSSEHPVLRHVIAFSPRLKLVKHVGSLMKLFIDIHKHLSQVFPLQEVVTCKHNMTVKEAIDKYKRNINICHDLCETFKQAKSDFVLINTLSDVLDGRSEGDKSWILEDNSLLSDIIIAGPSSHTSRLSALIDEVLSWQTKLYELCQRELVTARIGTSSLKIYLQRSLQRDPVSPEQVISHGFAELIRFTDDDIKQLLAVHCHPFRNSANRSCWNFDAVAMETQVVTQFVSKMRKIDWKAYTDSLGFRFRRDENYPMIHDQSLITTHRPTSAVQDMHIEDILFRLNRMYVEGALFDLRRLSRGLKRSHPAEDLRRFEGQPLGAYLRHRLDQGVEFAHLKLFEDVIFLQHIEALIRSLEKWLLNSEFRHIPYFLSQELCPKDKMTISESLERTLEEFDDLEASILSMETMLNHLLQALPAVESNPSTSISKILESDNDEADDTPISSSGVAQPILELPETLLGYHYHRLLVTLSSSLRKARMTQMQQDLESKLPLDPCCFANRRDTRTGAPVGHQAVTVAVTIKVHCEQVEPIISETFVESRSQSALAVIRSLLSRHGCDQTIICYKVGDKRFKADSRLGDLRHISLGDDVVITVWLQGEDE